MEHRWSRRIPVDLDAVVSRHGLAPAAARARDLCADGAFLQLDAESLRLAPGTSLVVDLELASGATTRRVQVRSTVVHHRRDGAGVMFAIRDEDTMRDIAALLHGDREPEVLSTA